MLIFETVAELTAHLEKARQFDYKIGFVPTMGALHEGHIALVDQSKANKDYTICSIFVNPTQFNDPEDLVNYPRTLDEDLALLKAAKTDVAFVPNTDEVYKEGAPIVPNFKFGQLTKVMEGAYRPGHFDGVVQVMYRLLSIVRPDRLYMGLKDFQQQLVIGEMLNQMEHQTTLIPVDIVRASDGLAMSSRNARLTTEQRQIAPLIRRILLEVKNRANSLSPQDIKRLADYKLTASGFKVDYFEVVNANNLNTIQAFEEADSVIACVAVWLGDIRLIDNIFLKQGYAS